MKLTVAFVALAATAAAQSYSVNLAGGITGSVSFTGLSTYSGDYRVDVVGLEGCSNPNTGAVHNVVSGVISLQWATTSNVIQARDWNSTSSVSNIVTMNTSAWPGVVDLRYQRRAGQWLAMEKWDHTGGGYTVVSSPLNGTKAINFATLAVGAATTGCKVGAVRVYLDSLPLGSTPPSAVVSPATGSLRAWEFNDRANPAVDTSGNGGNMTFNATPSWSAEDTSLACWASVAGNSVAGSPIQLSAYTRGTAASRIWQITSRPSLGAARLTSHSDASPSIINATAGAYSFSLWVKDSGGGATSCTATQTISAPPTGNGGYLKYLVGLKFDSVPGTDTIRLSVVQPSGAHVIGSPYYCKSSPCQVYVDDTGTGTHTYRLERLDSSGNVLIAGDWKPLNITTVPVAAVPAPPKLRTPKLEAVAYGTSGGARANQFIGERFDLRIAGGNPRPYNEDIKYVQYRDGTGFYYAGEYWRFREWMTSKGWNYEDGLLHAFVDHGNLQDWQKVNKFGEDQWNGNSQASKGVMIWNAATSTFLAGPTINGLVTPDHSEAAWNATTNDVPIAEGNTMYFGFPEPYDTVKAVVYRARIGGSVTWQYCSAAAASVCDTWSMLAVTDGSSGFTASAGSTVRTITFTPPSDWKAVIVNGSKPTFYLRIAVSGTTTSPILSQLYGQEWKTYGPLVNVTSISNNNGAPTVTTGFAHNYVAGDIVNIAGLTGGWATAIAQWERVASVTDSTHFTIAANTSSLGAWPGGSVTVKNREEWGWDPDDPNIITVAGGWEYNPTPPVGASAKFRHQSRVRHFFAATNDQFMFNDNAKDGIGTIYWSRYIAEGTVTSLDAGVYNGLMLDNVDAIPENVWIYNDLDWADPPFTYSSVLIRNKRAAAVTQMRAHIQTHHPAAVLGGNATYRTGSICFAMDFCHFENKIVAGEQYNFSETLNTDGDPIAMFDTLSDPVKNPNCSVGYVTLWSSDTLDPLDTNGVQYWFDKANRRPMLALATWYMGWNGDPCTGYSWNSGTFTYSADDDFYYATGDTYLTTPITGHPTNLQSFNVADTSALWTNLASMEMAMLIGDPPHADYFGVGSWSGNTINTNGAIHQSWPVGTKVRVRKVGHQGSTPIPWDRILFPAVYYPAMSVSIGTPTGVRNTAWKTPAEYGGAAGSADMSMRPYSNGIVVIRPLSSTARTAARMNGCSTTPMSLGGTYYRLHADGRTEAAPYTSIKLREGEAFIGLNAPTTEVTEVPAWQQNTCP